MRQPGPCPMPRSRVRLSSLCASCPPVGAAKRRSRSESNDPPRSAACAVAVVLATLLAACGGAAATRRQPAKTTTTPAATTTTVAPPVAPLTGLPDPAAPATPGPALSVKVENTDAARPQAGIDQADVVYEEVVEGDITRFVAMFNSTVPDVIGPVRSVRAEDPDIVWPVGGIFAYSGGAQVNVDAINAAPVHAVDEDTAGAAMVRNQPDQPPVTRRTTSTASGSRSSTSAATPSRRRRCSTTWRAGTPAVTGDGVLGFHVGFEAGYDPTWTWDAASGTWQRSIDGTPSIVTGSGQIAPANVVVQFTTVHRRGRGADRRRGRRVGVHRRRAAHGHVDAPRQDAAGQVRRRRRRPDPAAARPHLGRAAPAWARRST